MRPEGEAQGWVVDYDFLQRVQEQAGGLEECEAVILALVDLGFLELSDGK